MSTPKNYPMNIQIMYAVTAVLLEKLWSTHPIPQQIQAKDLSAELGDEYWSELIVENDGETTINFNEKHLNPDHVAHGTLTWLHDIGFINYQSMTHGGGFHQVRLTERGYAEVLKQRDKVESIVKRVSSAIKGTRALVEHAEMVQQVADFIGSFN